MEGAEGRGVGSRGGGGYGGQRGQGGDPLFTNCFILFRFYFVLVFVFGFDLILFNLLAFSLAFSI